ncbi:MAG: HAMP domain-containing sensor histidine kinase [Vampirovibrionales bacterium]|nr:HAMP domain-containing sensor histidine kinase [Vampirovibrionales bacterium]
MAKTTRTKSLQPQPKGSAESPQARALSSTLTPAQQALLPMLEAFTSALLLTEAKTAEIVFCNGILKDWLNPDECPTTLDALLGLAKGGFPVGTLKPGVQPPAADQKWMPQVVTLKLGPQQGTKLKIKYHPLTQLAGCEHLVLCQLDAFAEDVSLTQAHNEFVSTVSHEFRTPLTSIKGFADTMLRYGGQLQDDQRKRFVTIIKDQADRLTRLVENLLAVSKLGAGKVKMVYQPVQVQPLVEKIVEQLKAKGVQDPRVKREFKIDFKTKLPDAWADLDKYEQILLNLIDNGAKYSFADSTVVLTAEAVNDNDAVRVNVTNTGVGIPADKLPRIFSQFSRIENPLTRDVEGTGLGLYITKSLALALGGDITVESTPNETTTFSVTLPAATAERQEGYRRKLLLAGQTEEDGNE